MLLTNLNNQSSPVSSFKLTNHKYHCHVHFRVRSHITPRAPLFHAIGESVVEVAEKGGELTGKRGCAYMEQNR